MKKRKKKNYERAHLLKINILKFNNKVILSSKNIIKFKKSNIINGVNTYIFNHNNIIDNNFNLENDNLINGRPLKDVLVKTYKILLLHNKKQKRN